jgi:TolB-like protein/Flp pilus assembly protein TadD
MSSEMKDPDLPQTPPGHAPPEHAATPPFLTQAAGIWNRIKEHKVVQWALAYAAAGYAVLHVTAMVSDAFDWPHLVLRVATILLLMGLPVAATLAWYHGARLQHRISGPELAILTLLLLIAGAVLTFVRTPGHEAARPQAAAAAPEVVAVPVGLSIAVLPFADMSASQDQGYFADGMAEEILDILGRIPQLKVIGRTSSFQFKGRSEDLRAIGERLGAAYVVEGSVRKAGARIRVTAQLIDAHTGTHLWADSYDREFGDILNLQDQIAAAIARALQLAVVADDLRPSRPLQSTEAYTHFLRGRAGVDRGDETSLREAVGELEEVLALDQGFTRAAEALALANLNLIGTSTISSRTGWPLAASAARKALRLDPHSAVAHAVLGLQYATYDFNWAAAGEELDQALALKSRDPVALYLDSWLAFDLGRFDESLRLQNASLSIDPLNPDAYQNGGIIYYLLGNPDAAEHALRASIEISPSFAGNHWYLGLIQLQRGQPQAALKEMQAEQTTITRDAGLAMAFHALHRRTESDAALARAIRSSTVSTACNIAIVFAYRGERDQAFKWLERSVEQRDILLGHKFRNDPWLAPLRGDPRYKALLRRMNLPE